MTRLQKIVQCVERQKILEALSEDDRESLVTYCLSCRGRRRDSRMREKISKLGIEDHDRTCVSCNNICGVEDFYLIENFKFVSETFLE